MRVLVVAPHPDDECLGCGGAVLRHTARGDVVDVVFVTSGELGLPSLPAPQARSVREAEARAAATVLGVARHHFLRLPDWYVSDHVQHLADVLGALVDDLQPELIYVPHAADAHPDHAATSAAMGEVVRRIGPGRLRVLCYEVWTPLGAPDELVDISDLMERKLEALSCHASQLGYYEYDKAIEGLNRYRGLLGLRVAHAEAFVTLSSEGA